MNEAPAKPAQAPQVIPTIKARGAVVGHNVRYVLAISVVLAVAGMIFAYLRAPSTAETRPDSTVEAARGQ